MASVNLLFCVATLLSLAIIKTTADKDARYTWFTTERPHYTSTSYPHSCPSTFSAVGDRCILVVPFLEATWEEGKFYCHTVNAEYVQTDTAQFFFDLVNFLRLQGLNLHSYWLGARDMWTEGDWRWDSSGGKVPMEAPFWALKYNTSNGLYMIEPLGKDTSNCLRMDTQRFMYLDDDNCTSHNSIMCETMPGN